MTLYVLDSGLGNVRSVASMLRRAGQRGELIERPVKLSANDQVILPGVGAFDAGMAALAQTGLDDFTREAADLGCPVLGICLGMQLLGRGSEEGGTPGLGIVPAEVRRLPAEEHGLRSPHMGWNVARPLRPTRLFDGAEGEQRFYFVHTYHMVMDDPGDAAATTPYGIDFTCAFERGNVMGVQFHPEKSHRFGLALLQLFVGKTSS